MTGNNQGNWRNTARPARFLGLDAKATFPVFIWMCRVAWWTFFIAVASILFFWFLERFGYNVTVLYRMIRLKISEFFLGDLRPGGFDRAWHYRRRLRR